MRKLKLQVQITLDGFMAGPNGEMDWVAMPWTDDLNQYVQQFTNGIGTLALGRKLAEGFIPFWASVAVDESNPERESGVQFSSLPKVVFSKTLKEPAWENTTVATGDLAVEIGQLKNQPGQDIAAYGGAGFVSSLIRERLIDELFLYVNPVAIGQGMPIFAGLAQKQAFQLVEAKTFACGIVLLHYRLVA